MVKLYISNIYSQRTSPGCGVQRDGRRDLDGGGMVSTAAGRACIGSIRAGGGAVSTGGGRKVTFPQTVTNGGGGWFTLTAGRPAASAVICSSPDFILLIFQTESVTFSASTPNTTAFNAALPCFFFLFLFIFFFFLC